MGEELSLCEALWSRLLIRISPMCLDVRYIRLRADQPCSLYHVDLSCQPDVHDNQVRLGPFDCQNGIFSSRDLTVHFIAVISLRSGSIKGWLLWSNLQGLELLSIRNGVVDRLRKKSGLARPCWISAMEHLLSSFSRTSCRATSVAGSPSLWNHWGHGTFALFAAPRKYFQGFVLPLALSSGPIPPILAPTCVI